MSTIKTLPVLSKKFFPNVGPSGKTLIECNDEGNVLSVWADGNQESSPAILCSVQVNNVGDKFLARNDSRTLVPAPTKDDPKATKPAYLKGEWVTRLTESVEFKGLSGANQAANFAQAASAFKLQLVVQM